MKIIAALKAKIKEIIYHLTVSEQEVLDELTMVKNIGNKEFPYPPRHYKFYRKYLTGEVRERIDKIAEENNG